MKERLNQWIARINALEVRERALLLGVILVVLILGFDLLVYRSNAEAIDSGKERLQALQQETMRTQAQLAVLRAELAKDPDAPLRDELAQLGRQSEQLQGTIADQAGALLSPQQMRALLQDMLEATDRLKLIAARSIEPRPLVVPPEDLDAQGSTLFEHRMEVEFCADYLSALAALERLEAMPWQLVWQDLHMKAGDGRPCFRIGVATYSFEEDALGV